MITSKQRAYLRSLANGVPSICQIGKDGITENLIKQLDSALTAREIVKANVLDNAPCSAGEACTELSLILSAEPVQVIGRVLVLYRQSADEKKRTINLKGKQK